MGFLVLNYVGCLVVLWVSFLFQILSAGPVCPPVCTCINWEVNCRRRNLYELPGHMPPTTRRLILAENHFLNIPPLEISYLNEISFLDWSNNELELDWEFIFPSIDKLSHLDLSFNKLNGISPHTFSGLKRLVMLNLSGNPYIQYIDGYSFANNHLLTYLDISDCGLTNITITLFLKMRNVQALGMKQNPWNCDCTLLDFIKWMKYPLDDRVLLDPDEAKCSIPEYVAGIPIMKAEKTVENACLINVDLYVLISSGLIACGAFLGGTFAAWLLGLVSILYYHPIFKMESDFEDEGEYRGI